MTRAALEVSERAILTMNGQGNANHGVTVAFDESHVQIAPFRGVPNLASFRFSVTVRGLIDGEPAALYLPPGLYYWCVETVFGGKFRDKLDSSMAGLLFESALADQLDRLESALGLTIEIKNAVFTPIESIPEDINLALRVDRKGRGAQIVFASVNENVAAHIVELWCGACESSQADAHVSVSARVGATEVARQDLQSLKVADVLLVDRSPLLAKKILLVVEESLCTLLEHKGDQFFLDQPFGAIDTPAHCHFFLGQQAEASQNVVVAIDLARTMVPVSRIGALMLGEPFELPHGIDGPLEIYDGQTLIAAGKLVKAGDNLGVQITRRHFDG